MSTQLRELFDDAAESQPPHDLAERAIGGARARRRQRFAVGGSVLAAAAVVLGVVVASDDLRTDSEPRPTDVASLPAQLPSADGLPSLADGTMDTASAAYVVDGEVVVIDAATGDGAVVDFESMPLNFVGSMTGVTDRSVLALSPDGRALVVSTGNVRREVLLIVDVGTGRIVPENRFFLSQQRQGAQWSRVAWSPDSEHFACICRLSTFPASIRIPGSLLTMDVTRVEDDLQFLGPWGPRLFPRQISWGTDGLAAQFVENNVGWRVVPLDGQPEDSWRLPDPEKLSPVESVTTLAPGVLQFSDLVMGRSPQGGFLGVLKGSREYWIVNDVQDWTVPSVSVRPLLGALGSSYFTVFTDWKGDPVDDEVTRIDSNGETTTTLTTLPPGAAKVSFASDLVD